MADPVLNTALYWQWYLDSLRNNRVMAHPFGMGTLMGDPFANPPANQNRAIRPVSQANPGTTINTPPQSLAWLQRYTDPTNGNA
jgi:hypothetical protein